MKIKWFVFSIALSFLLIPSSCEDMGLTESEVVRGLKEALRIGTQNSVEQLNRVDGYFGNQLIRILLPEEANKAVNTVNSLLGPNFTNNLIERINRAAEAAASEATPIFINAINGITIEDGFAILRGADNAATEYLRSKTFSALFQAYEPKINASLTEVGAQQLWTQFTNTYNNLPTTFTPIPDNLSEHTTTKALDGLFVTIAQEEKKIRENPEARVNDILRKVFGND